MKVIDLLNKIANGEKIPKEMCIQGDLFLKSDGTVNTYEVLKFLCKYNIKLNEEIEIIEDIPKEEKKIPKKINKLLYREDYATQTACIDDIIRQFNNLIDYLKSKGE